MSATPQAITDALKAIDHPFLGQDIVALEMIRDVSVDGGTAKLTLELSSPASPVRDALKARVEEVLGGLEGVSAVDVALGHRVRSTIAQPPPPVIKVQPGGGLPIGGAGQQQQGPPPKPQLRGVANVVAVASGKGGVGKSTATANLALALARSGARVGVVDADIHGPSIPGMFGLTGRPDVVTQHGMQRIVPLAGPYGLKVISMGFLLDDPDEPAILRGPMVTKVLTQFIFQVDWGELDYLLLDLPPGTGDVHLTLVQTAPMSGGVIITTPQDVALSIARKGLKMFEKVQVPILGIVENMSGFVCPSCNERHDIFSSGGGRKTSVELGVPFLGEIPLDPQVVLGGDAGMPSVASHPDAPSSQAYAEVAGELAARLAIMARSGAPYPSFQWEYGSGAGAPPWNEGDVSEGGPRTVPAGIRKVDATTIEFLWRDGVRQALPLREIRLQCRCAHCVEEVSGRKLLDPATIPADITAATLSSVGVYAVSIDWATNNCANIHSFESLRRLGDRLAATTA